MAAIIYVLCALTSFTCAVLLLRSWSQSRVGLLFWSGLCFLGLTVSNVVLVLDRLVYTQLDLTMPRTLVALGALLLLLFGLIWEND